MARSTAQQTPTESTTAAPPAPPESTIVNTGLDIGAALSYVNNNSLFEHDVTRAAALFKEKHSVVHAGLEGFDGVPQTPSPNGVCGVLCSAHAAKARIIKVMVGTLTMLCVHSTALSAQAQAESGTYISFPCYIDGRTLEELVPCAFLDGLLPRPECLHPCPSGHAHKWHDPRVPSPMLANGFSYNAWLQRCLNKRWRSMLSGDVAFDVMNLLDLLLRWAMAAFMAYCNPLDWERCWGGVWGGNIHATRWLKGRVWAAMQLDADADDVRVGYGDAPCLAIAAKCKVPARDRPGIWEMQLVNAHQLQFWLKATGCSSHSRAQFRMRCMVAWRMFLLALHPSTLLVLDCTSWWCHAQYLLLTHKLADALRIVQPQSDNARMVNEPPGYTDPLLQCPTLLLDYRVTRGTQRGHSGDPSAWLALHAIHLCPHAPPTPLITMHMIKGPGAEGHIMGSGSLRNDFDGGTWHGGGVEDLVTKVTHGMITLERVWEAAPCGHVCAPPPCVLVLDSLGARHAKVFEAHLRAKGWSGDLYCHTSISTPRGSPPTPKRKREATLRKTLMRKASAVGGLPSRFLEEALSVSGPRRGRGVAPSREAYESDEEVRDVSDDD